MVFLVLVVLFIWAYFRQWKMSVAAIVALAHDVVITIGIYALSGFEVTPATVTGVLTILGFSLYDTVVVFDKVRENTKNLRERRTTYAAQANLAVNQTLVRSINTSIVALIPVGAILYVGAVQLGSSSLKDLALALFVGMAAGAYSSIFIATPLLAQLKSSESEVQLAEKRAKAPGAPAGRPVRLGAGVHRGHADPGRARAPAPAPTPAEDAWRPTPAGAGVPPRPPAAAGWRRPSRGPVGPSGAVGSPAAVPAEQVQAGQEVTRRGRPAARAALDRLVVDVPDFPEPGIVFKDITPLLADHDGFTAVIAALAAAGRDADGNPVVDKVVGMEARGFILAAPVALALGTGFVPVRKAGKLPRATHAVSYALEYGEATLELHRDAIAPGDRVLLVDDVLATGGTAAGDPRAGRELRRHRARARRAHGARLPARPRGGRRPPGHHADDGLSRRPDVLDWSRDRGPRRPADAGARAPARGPGARPAACGRAWPGWAAATSPATRSSSRCSGPCGPTTPRPTWRCSSAPT